MPAPVAARQPEGRGSDWFSGPQALRLQHQEQRWAIPPLTGCYGTTGLYVRAARDAPEALSGNMLQCVMRLFRTGATLEGDLACIESELPLARESIDLVYLLHALETSADPRELLIEVERVLSPEGNLMLIVMNPYSLWRVRWAGRGVRAIGSGRIRRWLAEAGLEVVRKCGLGPLWPWMRERPWFDAPEAGAPDALWPCRAAFLIHARKRRRGMTPARPRAGAVAFSPGMRPG